MRLLCQSNYLQLFADPDGSRIMLVNMNEKDFAFKRVMLDQQQARDVRILLETVIKQDEEKEDEL